MRPKYQIIHEFCGKIMRGRFYYDKAEAEKAIAEILEIYKQYNFEAKVYLMEV